MTLRRWGGALAALLLVLLASCFWEPFSVPRFDAPDAFDHDARIVRDSFGVPHVYGRRDADTAYGLAFAHAEDDFSTLQEVIAMTRGR